VPVLQTREKLGPGFERHKERFLRDPRVLKRMAIKDQGLAPNVEKTLKVAVESAQAPTGKKRRGRVDAKAVGGG